ncbi:MAG: glycosyltransferase family 4 protein [Anaerolineae bacterium]|nr:glycosyltransferase family 4 protein [Anaerolineae bacterium]
MKLCYLANPNSIHTQRWLRYFLEQGYDVHLISTSGVELSQLTGIKLHKMESPIHIQKIGVLGLAYRLRQLLKHIQPDILHAHQVSTYGWLGALSGYHPLIITAWGSDLLRKPQQSLMYRLLTGYALRRADYVTCVSEDLAQKARAFRMPETKIEVAPWGVDTSIFHPVSSERKTQVREKLGLVPGPLVLSLRPIRPIYNPLDIAEAIPLILKQIPETQFVIRTYACDSKLLARFQSIIERSQAEKAVHYIGELPDDRAIAELYQSADIAVSVPDSDGTPLSVLEALACGNALVVSNLPSLHEWVQDEKEALLVETGDVPTLASAITRLLRDQSLRWQLTQNALDMIARRADGRVWMKRAEGIYHDLPHKQQRNS